MLEERRGGERQAVEGTIEVMVELQRVCFHGLGKLLMGGIRMF